MSQSSISKIENGYSKSIDVNQLERVLNILKPTKIIRQQISLLLFQQSAVSDTRFIYPFTDLQTEGNDLQKTTNLFRCYVVCGICGVLQTIEYRIGYLKRLGFSKEEIAVEVGKTIERQEAMWDASKTFFIVMPEAALYTLPADTRIQVAQMDRLERIIGAENVHIGIIPMQAGVSVFETGTFTFYDDRMLYVFMGDRIVRLQDPETFPKYLIAFDELSYMASFDSEAIPLIRKAADYFAGKS